MFDKIKSELSKEWRDVDNNEEFEKILSDLKKKKSIKNKAKIISVEEITEK